MRTGESAANIMADSPVLTYSFLHLILHDVFRFRFFRSAVMRYIWLCSRLGVMFFRNSLSGGYEPESRYLR